MALLPIHHEHKALKDYDDLEHEEELGVTWKQMVENLLEKYSGDAGAGNRAFTITPVTIKP